MCWVVFGLWCCVGGGDTAIGVGGEKEGFLPLWTLLSRDDLYTFGRENRYLYVKGNSFYGRFSIGVGTDFLGTIRGY